MYDFRGPDWVDHQPPEGHLSTMHWTTTSDPKLPNPWHKIFNVLKILGTFRTITLQATGYLTLKHKCIRLINRCSPKNKNSGYALDTGMIKIRTTALRQFAKKINVDNRQGNFEPTTMKCIIPQFINT